MLIIIMMKFTFLNENFVLTLEPGESLLKFYFNSMVMVIRIIIILVII